jgi:NAD(P)-dependent dehydrogenase (short-subunit alcohol dehydrogenase family)
MLRRLSPRAETVRFEDRAANVTGGAQGIGKSIAAAFVTLICPSASPERQVWPVRCREFMVRLAPARDQLGLALTRAQAC